MSITNDIKQYAQSLGFGVTAVASAQPFAAEEQTILGRIQGGYLDGLSWFTAERARLSCDPQRLLSDAQSIISLALNYWPGDYPETLAQDQPRGLVARYAWGADYHPVIKDKLKALIRDVAAVVGHPFASRLFVDTGPMVDRAAAARSGVGWYGKNTNILTRGYGSWVFLGQILTDLELEEDRPLLKRCGNCSLCIQACPTGAIVEPYALDSRRCISYLTIENRGAVPRDLRPLVGQWLFGCDVCQEVCPVNRRPRLTQEAAFLPTSSEGPSPLLFPILEMDDAAFRQRFRDTALWRAKRVGLQRNACIVLGNVGDSAALSALEKALLSPEPLVRSHAAWASGRIGGRRARQALEQALLREESPRVREEIDTALDEA